MSLSDLMKDGQFKGTHIKLATHTTVIDFDEDGKGECSEQLGTLKILNTYKEKYLTARLYNDGI